METGEGEGETPGGWPSMCKGPLSGVACPRDGEKAVCPERRMEGGEPRERQRSDRVDLVDHCKDLVFYQLSGSEGVTNFTNI